MAKQTKCSRCPENMDTGIKNPIKMLPVPINLGHREHFYYDPAERVIGSRRDMLRRSSGRWS